ncbi:MAG TPA: signal peptidase I [Clostridiales bacterium]|nr:signal peptidase I [Clostridiales bacterium]
MKSILIDLLVYSIILFVSLKIVPLYVVQRTIVDGPSMMETLQDGESLIVEKISYRFTDIKRFDIVIFFPYGPEIDEYYVKRIIALPNETIQIIDDNIYIDGKLEEENFGKDPIEFQGIAEEPITLGEDEYFVMGDNRNLSLDSRYESLGPINKKNIVGKAVLRIWPLKDFKVLK